MNIDTESYFKSILDRGTLPHAMIFVGAEMKKMQQSAYSFIWEVFQRSGLALEALAKIESHNHPDVKELFPSTKSGNYTIEQVREFCEQSSLFPNEAPKQFFLIHYADRMQDAAANAFLKTLEEPNSETIFILFVQDLDHLLPTIVSRAISVPFESEVRLQDTPYQKKLDDLLNLWPKMSYNDVFTQTEAIQHLIEENESTEASEQLGATFVDQEIFKLFIQIEKWYQKNKLFKGMNMICESTFEQIMADAQTAVHRSMKPAVILEYLLLNFVSENEGKL